MPTTATYAVALAAKLSPVAMIVAAAGIFVARVEDGGPYVARNLLPLVLLLGLGLVAVVKNGLRWWGEARRWTLGAAGFAVPALGLTLYLHAAWFYDIDGVASAARTPDLLFRFLPYYSVLAGLIGFAIGWIIGRNLPARPPAARREPRS